MSQCNTNNIRIFKELRDRIKKDVEDQFGSNAMWLKGFLEHSEGDKTTFSQFCEKMAEGVMNLRDICSIVDGMEDNFLRILGKPVDDITKVRCVIPSPPRYCSRRLNYDEVPPQALGHGFKHGVVYYDDIFPTWLKCIHRAIVSDNNVRDALNDFHSILPKYTTIKRCNKLPEDFKVSLKTSYRHYDTYNIKDTMALQKINRRGFPHDSV